MEKIYITITADNDNDLAVKVKDKTNQGWECDGFKLAYTLKGINDLTGLIKTACQQRMYYKL